ncbi:dTDP-4-amino-4,6-dideoxygalactose transaminase [Ferruginibacter lapsinanis]|uniref:dTDP-4-amino-4,6-dideoxygalactose transaminase n=1 Tax=Ferruginibacter lapsinanis TaxID=563172 RepID=UPI001E64A835|nr:dTDP-4-amino-4,6-dideoxygalactose transaminase [Ferruginibacter lapsinanis]UEG49473.1 dTDP-4-amino-4,6-dideoxygalactose transaminase [Ferruginibacter lapsinanis]
MHSNIPFNIPYISGTEINKVTELFNYAKFCGDGKFTKLCNEIITEQTQCKKTLLTTSCTHALEMAAILCGIAPGDEVIMPSFTFVSTANAFVLRGARIKFVDIRPDTMNINELLIENAITAKTKAIVVVHYGGVACEMDTILTIAQKHGLFVIEDAAQCVQAFYKGKHLGTIGEFGTLSFHDTKNIHCGEGGALLINDERFTERAEIIREKGTDRSKYIAGLVDKYSWVDLGSSYLPNELSAAFLSEQLINAQKVTAKRIEIWDQYFKRLSVLKDSGKIMLPFIPTDCKHNAHLFFIKCADIEERAALMAYLKNKNITTTFHYIPLHSSKAGAAFGDFVGDDEFTTKESNRLLRLPMYYSLNANEVDYVCDSILSFYN